MSVTASAYLGVGFCLDGGKSGRAQCGRSRPSNLSIDLEIWQWRQRASRRRGRRRSRIPRIQQEQQPKQRHQEQRCRSKASCAPSSGRVVSVMAGSAADQASACVVAHGHAFQKKTFHKPTYCHHCGDMLWGLIQQGFVCEVCNFVVHERCSKTVISPCSSVASSLVKNPVGHCWSEALHQKRKFCNVCRKRLDDCDSIHCEICQYYVHVECQEFAVPDCKENATYTPGKELEQVQHTHHWREGNLPSGSKCEHCRKTCSNTECLSGKVCTKYCNGNGLGYSRLEWGIEIHGISVNGSPIWAPFTVKYDTDKREVSHLFWRFREPSGLPGGNYVSDDENHTGE
ncbi:hypothetical protein D910_03903 [Dendroctonus ponderosae]|uniref:Phorbol-ester/DAG-type domain-containing protein n=1 Tax=Dendroctonus ponderosae TaxID=77166 RepID=U4TY07_DENPD|nr:hypothetical protein D910_03903 [Dendroctonus ponderosae]